MLNVHSIESFGAHEGPGLRLVVFLQKCNFKCLYCHNPDTIEYKLNKQMPTDQIIKMLEDGKPYYHPKGGITFSGGEPTLQAKDILEVFKIAKNLGYHTCLDSNGSILNDDVKELLKYTDLVLLDVKHIDKNKHFKLTGQYNTGPIKMAKYLSENNVNVWLRYVLVPGYSDDLEDVKNWCKTFANYQNIEKAEILPYHALGRYKYKPLNWEYKLDNVQPPSKELVEQVETIFKEYFNKVVVR